MAGSLLRAAQTAGPDDGGEIRNGRRKLMINNNIIELAAVTHLFLRRIEATGDHFRAVLPAFFQPFAQHRQRRRKDEYVHR